ncbi:TonB-dependent receptor [Cyanosarcina cf. burmensis CCALA 770]|nr:TonB-dependent receptor [Cyanosarcina cf. burmensis CCALA 770]
MQRARLRSSCRVLGIAGVAWSASLLIAPSCRILGIAGVAWSASPLIAQPAQAAITQVTDVRVNSTDSGVELILATADGAAPRVITAGFGNTYVANIINAQLRLPQGKSFRQENPAAEIASVSVEQTTANSIRVRVVGKAGVPPVQVQSGKSGLVLSLGTAPTPSAQRPAEVKPAPTPPAEQPTPPTQKPSVPVEGETAPGTEDEMEIVVTAEKTEENVQNVPISITPFTEQQLEDTNTTSFTDVARRTPNFSIFDATGSRYFNIYSIRGLSNSNFASRDAAGFYIDDIPYDYGGFITQDLIDLERVEVLRGPQSTLYGRSAQAGVVNVITRRPPNEFEFRSSASYGNFDDLDVQASVGGPLIPDRLAFRLSGSYGSRDGYFDNVFLDNKLDDQSGGNGRGQLLWTPSDEWEVLFNTSFADYNDGVPLVLVDSTPFEVEQDFNGVNSINSNTQALRVAYNGDNFRFTSITSRRFSRNQAESDLDGTTVNLGTFSSDFDSTLFSQEVRLQSPEESGPWQWLVGSYFESRAFNTEDDGLNFGEDAVALGFPAGASQLRSAEVDEKLFAVFSQVSYDPIENLTLTAGLRYETINSTLDNFENVLSAPGSPDQVLASFDNIEQDGNAWLPRFAVEYRFNPEIMAYASVSRGYRPGGVNYRAENENILTYEPERSWSYEVGLKSSWFEDRLGLNLAFFHNPVNDYQVNLPGPFGQTVEIANADASITGFEIEARATPVDGFDITAGLGFVDAEFTNYSNPFTGEDFNGNKLPFSPDLTYNLALQYRSPGGIFGRIELLGTGKTYFDESNEFSQGAFALVNAKLGYEFNNYGIYLFANNIFDKEYLTLSQDLGFNAGQYGTPATFGIQFKSEF